jgi:membrane-associated phospholipid phosphatase
VPLVWGVVAFALLLPFDGVLSKACEGLSRRMGGDVRRELLALQQYGQFSVSLIVALIVALADPKNRGRLWEWLVSWGIAAAIVFPMKVLVGRPRPKFDAPWSFPGPFGSWPLGLDGSGRPRGVHHAWELWAPISSDLWSMPSSHTAYAVVMSALLARVYSRIAVVLFALAGVVGVCRVLFDGHYPSDVAVGAAIGFASVRLAVDGGWARALAERFGRGRGRQVV